MGTPMLHGRGTPSAATARIKARSAQRAARRDASVRASAKKNVPTTAAAYKIKWGGGEFFKPPLEKPPPRKPML